VSASKQIVIIALGNRFRGDDGIGSVVAESLKRRLEDCTFVEGQDDSLAIINAWKNANLAVIVDASSPDKTPGKITRLEIDDQPLPRDMASCSSHGLGLAEAIELGRTLGKLPDQLVIYAVEAESFEHGTSLSPGVMAAAKDVAHKIEADVTTFTTP
jgi:hydrogenase maturation protease